MWCGAGGVVVERLLLSGEGAWAGPQLAGAAGGGNGTPARGAVVAFE